MTKQFSYYVTTSQLILMPTFASALPIIFSYFAINNNKGLVINGIIKLPFTDATLFFWGVAFICLLAVFCTFISTYNMWLQPKTVELSTTHAHVPKASMFGGELIIPYESITKANRQKISGNQELLIIESVLGKSRLLSSNFKGILGYTDFLSALDEHLSIAKNQHKNT